MNQQSGVKAPLQPSSAFYPADVLKLFTETTRAANPNAPSFDLSRAPKSWADPTLGAYAPTDIVTYNYIDESVLGQPRIAQLQLEVRTAETLNLLGLEQFPQYVVAPTQATITLPGSAPAQLNPSDLSTASQAAALAQAWGTSVPTMIAEVELANATYNWGAELRRTYYVIFKNSQVNVGAALAMMNAGGVGAPGSWDLSGALPKWVAAVENTTSTNMLPPVPMPVRALTSTEALWGNAFGAVEVYRTDMPSQYNPATPPPATAGLTAGQAQMLSDILTAVTSLSAHLGFTFPPK